MGTFTWKRRKDTYTVTDSDRNFLFDYNILIDKGPPPRRMKHPDVLKEIELRIIADFIPKVESTVDQEGNISI